ncbi:unnamed protein product [Protopolystoma xenopodis]|uniref:Uncharacterized protein n=1 Tax=Protopolystoma xenopodis TaxID=117903 RepID=A0A448XDJ9_9PLAT|nr:unnamed protein product [Protopolystoma xenopodis]
MTMLMVSKNWTKTENMVPDNPIWGMLDLSCKRVEAKRRFTLHQILKALFVSLYHVDNPFVSNLGYRDTDIL